MENREWYIKCQYGMTNGYNACHEDFRIFKKIVIDSHYKLDGTDCQYPYSKAKLKIYPISFLKQFTKDRKTKKY